MTKPITTVAALILVERGLLSIHDPVSKFIPAFQRSTVFVSGTANNPVTEPLQSPLTIHHLMTHTSGIPYSIFGDHPCDEIVRLKVGEDWKLWYMNTDLELFCNQIAESPLAFQPGTSFLYGLNTDVLGRVIEVISGVSLDVFLAQEIFIPLGMTDTGFFVTAEKLHRLVDSFDYVPVSHSLKVSDHPERDRSIPHTLRSGGGGLVSTLRDYARFARCLLNMGELDGVRILSEASVTLMTSNQLHGGVTLSELAMDSFSESVGKGFGFGLGVSVLTDASVVRGGSLGEYGWGGVANTNFAVDPVQGRFMVFMTQLVPSTSYPIRSQMRYLVDWMLQNDGDKPNKR